MIDNNKTLYIRPMKVVSILGCIAGILILMSIIDQLDIYLFNRSEFFMTALHLDGNNTIPTYFSTTLLTLSSILLLMIGVNAKEKRDHFSFHWIAMAIVFLFVSIDKMVDFHNKLKFIWWYASNVDLKINFIWIILVITLVLAISYMRFMLHLTSKDLVLLLLAAIFFFSGAVGMDYLGGKYATFYSESNLTYGMLTTLEEGLEMTGSIVFIYALLNYMSRYGFQIIVRAKD